MNRKKTISIIVVIILMVAGSTLTQTKNDPVDDEKIKVGVLMPFTESFGWWGEAIRNSIELSISNGEASDFEFYYQDTKCQSKEAVNATRSLKALHPDMHLFIVGCDTDLKAMFPILNKETDLAFMVGLSGSDLYQSQFPVINLAHRLEEEARVSTEFAINQLGARSLGIFVDNSAFGDVLSTTATKIMNDFGGTAYTERLKHNEPNPETSVLKVIQTNPDAIYIQNDIPGISRILKRLEELNYGGEKLVYYGGRDQSLIETAGVAAENVYIPWVISEKTNPIRTGFENSFLQKYGEEPFVTAYFMYDGLLLLEDARNSCKNDVECIRNFFYSNDDFAGTLGDVLYRKNGDIERSFYIQTVVNGSFAEVK